MNFVVDCFYTEWRLGDFDVPEKRFHRLRTKVICDWITVALAKGDNGFQ